MSQRSKRYQTIQGKLKEDKGKILSIEEAVPKLKEVAKAKFDEAVEVHVKLKLNRKSGTQVLRGTLQFPKAFGKERKIAAFVTPEKVAEAKKAGAHLAGGEELITEIKNSQQIDFDVAVAEPALMRHLAQIGKLLGQKGLMPNPKNETVTPKVIEAIREFAKGKKSFKSDDQGIIHQTIGKISFAAQDLVANYKALLAEIKKQKPENQKGQFIESVHICSTMGPAIAIRE